MENSYRFRRRERGWVGNQPSKRVDYISPSSPNNSFKIYQAHTEEYLSEIMPDPEFTAFRQLDYVNALRDIQRQVDKVNKGEIGYLSSEPKDIDVEALYVSLYGDNLEEPEADRSFFRGKNMTRLIDPDKHGCIQNPCPFIHSHPTMSTKEWKANHTKWRPRGRPKKVREVKEPANVIKTQEALDNFLGLIHSLEKKNA